jgi:Fe(3+) dicitrate transport protein
MNKMKFVGFFVCLYLFQVSLAAQSGIKGVVTDKDNQPLPYADISIEGTVRNVTSNDQGIYKIQDIKPGNYRLKISYLGFQEIIDSIEVVNQKIVEHNYVMTDLVYMFDEVHIMATRTDGRHLAEVDGYSINATKKNELVRLDRINANLASNNARQIFQRTPGIHIWESDGSGIQMSIASRGLSPNRSWEFNTRMNGYDITPDPMGYPEAYYTPPSEVVEKIEIVKGAAALQFGPQFGGVVNFVLRKPDISTKLSLESTNTLGSNGLVSTFNYIGGTHGRFNYTAYYQKRRGDGFRKNSYFNTDHGHITLGYALTEKLKIGLELTYMDYISQQPGGLTDSLFNIDLKNSLRERNWFSAPWFVPAITSEYIVNKHTKLSWKAFGTIGQRSSIGFVKAINSPDNNGARQVDRDFYNNIGSELRLITDVQFLGKNHTFTTGLRYFDGHTRRWQQGSGDSESEYKGMFAEVNDYKRMLTFNNVNGAAFAEGLFRINNKLLATGGYRLEYIGSNANGQIGIDASGKPLLIKDTYSQRVFGLMGAGLEYHTSPKRELYFNISQAYRPVLFSDLTPPSTTDVIDPNLKDANGYNVDLGYRGKLGNYLIFDVDVFYLQYNNRIGTISAVDATNQKYLLRTNFGASTSRGSEIYLEFKPLTIPKVKKEMDFNVFVSLSFIDAKYRDFDVSNLSTDNANLKNLNGKQVENAPKYIHRFGATFSYKNSSITWQMSNVGSSFADASNTIKANSTSTIGLIPSYSVQDLSASIRLSKLFTLKTGVNNLMNASYFTRRAGGYPGPGLLPADGRTYYFGLSTKWAN